METLIILSKQPFAMEAIEQALVPHLNVSRSSPNQLTVHGETTRVYIQPAPGTETHGEFCLWVDYSSVELVKEVVIKIADTPLVTVDNDFGTVLRGDQFVARCKAEGGWTWRN